MSQGVTDTRLEGAVEVGQSGAVLKALGPACSRAGRGWMGLQSFLGLAPVPCCTSCHSQSAPPRSSGTLCSSPVRVLGMPWNVPSWVTSACLCCSDCPLCHTLCSRSCSVLVFSLFGFLMIWLPTLPGAAPWGSAWLALDPVIHPLCVSEEPVSRKTGNREGASRGQDNI